jgi:1,4-dihydroxy-2-naphthoate octaprenyltransferase
MSTVSARAALPLANARALLLMARPSQVALIGLIFLAGLLLAFWRGGSLDLPASLIAAALLVPTVVAAHWANEAADAATDALTTRTRFSGGSGALAGSGIRPGTLLRWSLLIALVVAGVAMVTVATGRLPVVAGAVLLLGLCGGIAYSVPPAALMRRGLGEPLNAVVGGLLLPLFGVAAARGYVGLHDVLAFLPFAFITLCSVMATAWPDRAADGATGKWTLQVRLEPTRLRAIYTLSALAWAVALGIAIGAAAMPFGLALFAIIPSVLLGWTMYTRRRSPWASVASMVGHIVVMVALTGIALTVAA